jgi:hypothetical protein
MDLYNHFQDCGLQLCSEKIQQENWYWDWYFLMQHHGAPTRLLDWSDGALIGLHFALRYSKKDTTDDAVVYVLNPDRLKSRLESLPDYSLIKSNWQNYIGNHSEFEDDDWETTYLPPDDEKDLAELGIPQIPCVLHLGHITRRVAAQRSKFVVFGTEPAWLYHEFTTSNLIMQAITIEASSSYKLKRELRESGVSESVIFPDLDGLGRETEQIWEDRK